MTEAGERQISRIAVVGAGLMGHGIALELAAHGYAVRLYDSSPEQLARAEQRLAASLALMLDSGNLSAEQVAAANRNLLLTADLAEAVADVDLVIEAVFEDLAVKQAVFKELDALAPAGAILASNTSSYLPSALAEGTSRPDRVIVTHYFNPPHLLPLVEVVPGPETSAGTVAAIQDLYTSIGKSPVVIGREIPGFVGNRLQTALLREALALIEDDVASAADIDLIIRTGFGRRLALAGVFEVRDLSGWAVSQKVHLDLLPEIESSREAPQVLFELGKKAGGDEPEQVARRAEIMQSLAAMKRVLDS